MDSWQVSRLSWSFSRKTHFDSCKRFYFYHRFWGQDPALRWRLFEMRNLTTLPMLRGQIVHEIIAQALNSIRMGAIITPKTARDEVTRVIRVKYAESAKRLWHIDNRPEGRKATDITSLLEHYYRFPNLNERAREAQRIAWDCVTNLLDSEFWSQICKSDPGKWMQIEGDGFPSFDLDGIQVYAAIDFAHENGPSRIIDWKTGPPNNQDRRQLTLYSLYAQQKWEWDPLQTELCAVYLYPEFKVESWRPEAAELDAVRDEVKKSFAEMMELEPAYGPADIANFPTNGEARDCAWCRFQGVCEKPARPPADEATQDAAVPAQ